MFWKKKQQPVIESAVVSAPVVEERTLSDDAQATESRVQRRRPIPAKTRLMGLDTSDGRVVNLFDEANARKPAASITFPVALVLVVDGPGRGETFALQSGMSQIGRGEDQAIRLDFGDTAISRTNHAAIVYDPVEKNFLLGHGGKANIVRVNGKPIVSSVELKDADEISIGETTMRFVAICSKKFNWDEPKTQERSGDNDLEIA